MFYKKLYLLIILFFAHFAFSAAFLECEESDSGKDWKNKKLLQTNFYIFSENDFKLSFLENEMKRGSYVYNKDRGDFEGPHPVAFSLDFIPIKYSFLKKASSCGSGARRSCEKHFSQIDRSTLEIQKYFMDGARGYFSPVIGKEPNLWKVSGMCKIIEEEDFFNKTFNLREGKSKKNKI